MLKKNTTPDLPDARHLRFAIITSIYNAEYVDSMLDAAKTLLEKAGAKKIDIVRVPGAFEIPVAAAICARSGKYDAVINLGLIFMGETYHAEHIGTAISQGLMQIALETEVPQIHEVLVCKTPAQAKIRCLNPKFNKGREAAFAAVQIARTVKGL
ncbi:MAG: 6,7-dimethyl-8-ribityllumazine synthase [Verrucomicrobiota bacterium]|nr:6,7-dimethyl-8-ribityllumazine synthase [Verrucomicrobiota bacterium]